MLIHCNNFAFENSRFVHSFLSAIAYPILSHILLKTFLIRQTELLQNQHKCLNFLTFKTFDIQCWHLLSVNIWYDFNMCMPHRKVVSTSYVVNQGVFFQFVCLSCWKLGRRIHSMIDNCVKENCFLHLLHSHKARVGFVHITQCAICRNPSNEALRSIFCVFKVYNMWMLKTAQTFINAKDKTQSIWIMLLSHN